MNILDKAKDVSKKGLDLGVRAGKKGIEVGKKGVDATKDAVRKKTCSECKHFTPMNTESGNCPIAGDRLANADSLTCPQRAFEFEQ